MQPSRSIHRPRGPIGSALVFALAGTLAIALVGCNTAPFGEGDDGRDHPHSSDGPSRLYEGYADLETAYRRPTSTTSAEAKLWFDQGLMLLYGFNHDEAIRSFRRASEIDPDFGLAWWGVAYAYGLHINNPAMTEVQSRRGHAAALEALRRVDGAWPVERALIEAVATRYEWPAPEDRAHLDVAYADAMEQVWRAFPDDPDVGALFAESLMNLQPWDLWTHDFEPKGRTLEIVETLERVIALREDHPGANHFYIHAVEASSDPHRAIPAADRLGALVPGSGHLVHMPSHIYARVGRWACASDANERAIAADRAYFRTAPPPEFYSVYALHNIHFLAWSAMMEGRFEVALAAARDVERSMPPDFLREWAFIADGFMPVTLHALIRFGKWEMILAEPKPPAWRHVSRTSWHYARGVALAALGRTREAHRELRAFEREAARIPDDWVIGNNPAATVMDVGRHMLLGELAYRERRIDEAFDLLRKAVTLEDALAYDEPSDWMQPVRHALGALLLAEGRAEEAEAVYRADLRKTSTNGWSLLGLRDALRAQGRDSEATAVDAELSVAWARADVAPVASCFCHPKARLTQR